MAQFKTLGARVLRSVSLSEFTKHIELEVSGVTRFGFVPGQWLSVKALTPEGEEMTRAYSIASPPSENGHFAFCLNRVQDGFMSNYLCNLDPAQRLSFRARSAISSCARRCATPYSLPPEPGSRPSVPCCTGCWRKAIVISDAISGCCSERAASRIFIIARSLSSSPLATPTFIFYPR